MSDIILETFEGFNFKPFKMPLIIVYNSPSDYKGVFIGRLWDLDKPTNFIIICKNFNEINLQIPHYFEFMTRDNSDDKTIVGVFI